MFSSKNNIRISQGVGCALKNQFQTLHAMQITSITQKTTIRTSINHHSIKSPSNRPFQQLAKQADNGRFQAGQQQTLLYCMLLLFPNTVSNVFNIIKNKKPPQESHSKVSKFHILSI